MKILVIEDDEDVLKFVCKILIAAGYDVAAASDGGLGLEQIKNNPDIAMVITDIIMPEKEGIETIREIKQTWPQIKIIAMSGGGIIHPKFYLRDAGAFGADAVIKKPLTISELIGTVENVALI
ncbi:MAG: response regulator [Lentisphaerota bacterium]